MTGDGTFAQHQIRQSGVVISGLSYTTSIYAKNHTNNFMQIYNIISFFGSNVWANFDLNNGVVGSVGTATTASIQNVGNGWYRCAITGTATASSSGSISFFNLITSATSVRGENNSLSTSVFLWGAQLEAGSYATSYIPTTTASVTRNADSITRNNIYTNGLITAAGGTWFVEIRNNISRTRDLASRIGIGDTSNLGANNISLGSASNGRATMQKFIAGIPTGLFTTTTDTCKLAIKWNGATADIFQNGVKVVSATAFTTTNMEFLKSNTLGVPFFINQMALFPTPLTDAQCLALTA